MPSPRRDNIWPRLIVAIGLLFFLFSSWSAYRAATMVSAVTDRDYYSHGLRYDQSLVEQRAAETMGWSLEANLSGDRLEIRLSDGEGRPVSGCRGEASLPGADRFLLHEDAPGLYSALLEPLLKGEFAAHLEFKRHGSRLSRRLLLSL